LNITSATALSLCSEQEFASLDPAPAIVAGLMMPALQRGSVWLPMIGR
jgi:hypothetical protein